MSKSILQSTLKRSVQKTARKNTKYSRKETILKIGHHAKAIHSAKSLLWVKNLKSKKHVTIYSTNPLHKLYAKKQVQKTPNMREMRPF